MTWGDAETHCETQGGHLVAIVTEKQRKTLAKNYQTAGKPYWVGLRKGESKVNSGLAQAEDFSVETKKGQLEKKDMVNGKKLVRIPWAWHGNSDAFNVTTGKDPVSENFFGQILGEKFNLNPDYDFATTFGEGVDTTDVEYIRDANAGDNLLISVCLFNCYVCRVINVSRMKLRNF